MHRLDSMGEGSLHPDILNDKIHDTLGNPGCCSWPAGIQKQVASLGAPSPFLDGHIRNVDHLAFRKAMLAQDMSVLGGGGGVTLRLVVLLPGVPNFAPLAVVCTAELTQSPTMSCPFQ